MGTREKDQKNQMAIRIVTWIIKKRVNNNIFNNIIDIISFWKM